IESMRAVCGGGDELLLAVERDEHRRGGRDVRKFSAAPHHATIFLPKRHHSLTRPADHRDDRVLVGNWAGRITGLDGILHLIRRRRILFDEVVRPENLARSLVEREELLVSRGGKEAIANNEWRRVRPCATAEIHRLQRGRETILPDCCA